MTKQGMTPVQWLSGRLLATPFKLESVHICALLHLAISIDVGNCPFLHPLKMGWKYPIDTWSPVRLK